jgi:hypothetical protein
MLIAPAGAAGAIRYAAPGAAGPEPCNPVPCSLLTAVNNAANGDQVIVTPGNYTVAGEILLDSAVDVGGQPGGPVPAVDLATKHFGSTMRERFCTICGFICRGRQWPTR